jgi:hypothetical protein
MDGEIMIKAHPGQVMSLHERSFQRLPTGAQPNEIQEKVDLSVLPRYPAGMGRKKAIHKADLVSDEEAEAEAKYTRGQS